MPRLIVIKGADEGKQFHLTEPVHTVGRDSGSQVWLHDTEVSRRHAEFRQADGGYRLLDVGSANGSFVNNQPVTDHALQSGDQIQIGQSILIYHAGRGEAQGPSDLADRISLITRHDLELSSAIIKTVGETEGSRILAHPDKAGTAWLKTALANLGVMYETVQAVSHIDDLDQLLERIMELIFRSIEADRGCLMLRSPHTGLFEPKAVRWRKPVDRQEKIALSRTIMDYVLRERQGVLVSDAPHDQRFNAGQSIVRFGIKEAICVPMKGRHETLGVLYLDTQSTARDLVARASATGKFTEDHLMLAIAIGHQAALAVEESRYHQAMLQAERLAAIGQTIANVAHHIKNILQGMKSGSEILEMGLAKHDDQLLQQGWRMLKPNQGKIHNLVMDMLSYSKDRVPAIEDADLNRIVQDVVELMQGRAKELGAKLETRLGRLPPVPCDPEGVHRSVLNIVTNALDAVEERKNPQVGIKTYAEPDGEWVAIEVLDNGPGIPAAQQPEVFQPFVSTKGSRGTGLGLAVSRKVFREHGGDITLDSQPGKPTRFTLRLPLKSPLGPELGGTMVDQPVPPPPDGFES